MMIRAINKIAFNREKQEVFAVASTSMYAPALEHPVQRVSQLQYRTYYQLPVKPLSA